MEGLGRTQPTVPHIFKIDGDHLLLRDSGSNQLLPDQLQHHRLPASAQSRQYLYQILPHKGSQLADRMEEENFCDHHDHFENTTPNSEYKTCLAHAEKIGLGTREYELIYMK